MSPLSMLKIANRHGVCLFKLRHPRIRLHPSSSQYRFHSYATYRHVPEVSPIIHQS